MSVSVAIRAEIHIAKQYEADGYTVIRNPRKELMPFDLEGYVPDILATRGDENILIEVKTSRARVNTEKLFKVSKIVQSYPGWKFSVVTVNEDDISEFKGPYPSPDIAQITKTLSVIEINLRHPSTFVFIIPPMWICYVSILSMSLRHDEVEVSGLSDQSILNASYSEGIINHEELELSKEFLSIRNFCAHNIACDINIEKIESFFAMTKMALNRYENKSII